jgi:threonine/homoserine/homoserine lactone efflux protein
MPDLSTLAIPFFASLALVVVPGPAVLYIITRSVDQGRTAGFASAAGIATGGLVHVAGAALGLSAIIASSSIAFSALKYVGAAYLIFLGIHTLLIKPNSLSTATRNPRTSATSFHKALSCKRSTRRSRSFSWPSCHSSSILRGAAF